MPFKSGYDPNRNIKGRPLKEDCVAGCIRDELDTILDESNGLTKRQALSKIIVNHALRGDHRFIEILMKYTETPIQAIQINSKLNDLADAIEEAVLDDKIQR